MGKRQVIAHHTYTMKTNIPYIFSIVLSLFVWGLYFLWFIVQDRRLVFLYGHLHTTPFDQATLSRHWVTGLVASGLVFFLSLCIFSILKKRAPTLNFSVKHVWKNACVLTCMPLSILLGLFGTPPMPIIMVILILLVLSLSLRLVLEAAHALVYHPKNTLFLWLDGLIFFPSLFLLPLLADYVIRKSPQIHAILPTIGVVLALVVGGPFIWFLIMRYIRRIQNIPHFSPKKLLLSVIMTTYILLPLGHYGISRPEHLYITNRSNIISTQWWIQLTVFVIVVGEIWIISQKRDSNVMEIKKSVTLIALLIGLMLLGNFTEFLYAPKTKNDIWVCENNQWVSVGQPRYPMPFAEECGIIDRAMGL